MGGNRRERQLVLLGLTPREAEVLYWVSNGKADHDIGVIVGASVRTIEKHVGNILRKLKVENRTTAAVIALGMLYQLQDFL